METTMKRPFLLTAGDNYYPESGTDDWIGCFETYELAESHYLGLEHKPDWYEIIDLRDWTN